MKRLIYALVVALIASIFGGVGLGERAFDDLDTFSVGAFSYQIPSGWVMNESNNDGVTERWHYGKRVGSPEGGYIYVRHQYQDMLEGSTGSATNVYLDSVFEGMTEGSGGIKSSEHLDINGLKGLKGYFAIDISNTQYFTSCALVLHKSEILAMSYMNVDVGLIDQQKQFDEIANHIELSAAKEMPAATSYEKHWMSYYEKAEYKKYNSPASENGLDGMLIAVEGSVSAKITIGGTSYGWVIEQDDGNLWLAAMPVEIDNVAEGDEVTCYGTYMGVSLNLNKMPSFMLLRYTLFQSITVDDVALADAYEGFSFDEIHNRD